MADFENVPIDVTAENLERVAKRPIIMYNGAPTTSTAGVAGQFYYDEINKKLYICVGTTGARYNWVSLNDLSEYVLNSLTIAGIDLKDNITADELKEALGIDLSKYVEETTKIAGLTLSSDILAEDLAKALSVSSVVVETKAPTFNDGEENTFWIDNTTNSLYYCDKRTLSGYNWIEIAGGSVTDEQIQNAVDNYLDENPVEIEGYVPETRTIADIDLTEDITKLEMQTALGIGDIDTALKNIIAIQEALINGNYTNGITLVDEETDVKYKLYVSNEKVTLEEVEQ